MPRNQALVDLLLERRQDIYCLQVRFKNYATHCVLSLAGAPPHSAPAPQQEFWQNGEAVRRLYVSALEAAGYYVAELPRTSGWTGVQRGAPPRASRSGVREGGSGSLHPGEQPPKVLALLTAEPAQCTYTWASRESLGRQVRGVSDSCASSGVLLGKQGAGAALCTPGGQRAAAWEGAWKKASARSTLTGGLLHGRAHGRSALRRAAAAPAGDGLLTAVRLAAFEVLDQRAILFNDCADRVAQLLRLRQRAAAPPRCRPGSLVRPRAQPPVLPRPPARAAEAAAFVLLCTAVPPRLRPWL